MPETRKEACCVPSDIGMGCCRVEALVGVDERGQMVLPKEVREKAGIKAGDKLALVSWERGEKVGCLCLIRAEDFAGMVRELLGPMMQELSGKERK